MMKRQTFESEMRAITNNYEIGVDFKTNRAKYAMSGVYYTKRSQIAAAEALTDAMGIAVNPSVIITETWHAVPIGLERS